ncbi:DUF4012 domain-containing protein [Patescibacteria group bacterium]|nr:DUF4012 domain-containing protein [Patescibacteria group bacterium]
MSLRSQQPNNQNKDKQMSQLFDEALPKKLKYEGIVEDKTTGPRIHQNASTPLSPYIIQLQREDTKLPEKSKIESLASQLLEEARDFEDEFDYDEGLEVNFDDLVSQLREPEHLATPNQFPKNSVKFTYSEKKEFSTVVGNKQMRTSVDLNDLIDETDEPTFTEQLSEINSQPKIRSFRLRALVPNLKAHQRAFVMFTLLSFVLVLPLHAMQSVSQIKGQGSEITDVGKNAIDTFFSGASALGDERFDVAQTEFARASESFSQAEDSLRSLNNSIAGLSSILPQTDRTYDSARGLLTAGQELSFAAEQLSQAAEEIESKSSLNVVTKLSILETYIDQALPHVTAAARALEDVDPNVVPEEYKATVVAMKDKVPQIAYSMEEFTTMSQTLAMILGENRTMRYLVTFQNNTELRPTGGFVGSFAEMDLLNGEIDSIYVPEGGTYDLQGQLSEFVASPHPLSLVNPRWEFHDANYFPDFPTSAKKMIWFYENAGGPTVDGMITINATFMPELLAILGPIEMPEYDRTIDSENFLFETQKIVEMEYQTYSVNDEERTVEAPKQFIGDLAPKILERLEEADSETMLAVLDLLGSGLSQKDVILYFDNNALQSTIEELGWSGSIKQTSGDYLLVTHTNLGGGKTDTVIDQDIYVDTTVDDDGSIINTVTITKEHHGLKSSLFEGENNVDYIRLYVPRGSELLSARGFEIPANDLFETSDLVLDYDEDLALLMTDIRKDPESKTDIWVENGKTVFGNWMQTAPAEIETVTFSYRLPFKLSEKKAEQTLFEVAKERLGFKDIESHSLLIQKQPGVNTRETHITLTLPENKTIVWSSHDAAETIISNNHDELVQFVIETN